MANGSQGSQQVKVVEAYVNYTPALNYGRMVERLLATVPEKYLNGLDSVVLFNMSGVPQRDKRGSIRRRKRRMKRAHAAGLYHPAWRGQKPWIQLFVDQIPLLPRPLRRIDPLCDLLLGSVFYHELGHHAHTLRPEFKEKEDVADSWAGRFAANHIKKAYWYLHPPLKFVALIRRWVRGKRSPARAHN
jgi:hypothetical protein